MSFWCLVKDDKHLIKRMFVQLHFGRASGPGISLASSSPWPHWPWMPQVAWRSHQHLPGHWPRMCEKFCEMVTPWLPINFKKAKWEGLIFKGFSMIFLWASIATWYIIYHPHISPISTQHLLKGFVCTIRQDPTWHRRFQGVVFVVKAIEPLTTALLAIPLHSQTFNLRLLGIAGWEVLSQEPHEACQTCWCCSWELNHLQTFRDVY